MFQYDFALMLKDYFNCPYKVEYGISAKILKILISSESIEFSFEEYWFGNFNTLHLRLDNQVWVLCFEEYENNIVVLKSQ